MPWASIPPERLADLSLFGIDLIVDHPRYPWYRGPVGRMRVDKERPRIFFEDASDAQQCGATAIMIAQPTKQ